MQSGGDQDYWQQHSEGLEAQDAPAPVTIGKKKIEPVAWQASEAIHHEKDALWFMGLVVIAVILLAISIFLMQSWTFAALVVVMAVAAGIIASRPPRVVQYQLSPQGIQINDTLFNMHDFRAFGVVHDGPLYSAVLIPNKRFMPSVSVYFPEEAGERIIDVFGSVLPMENVELDIVDKLTRKLRF